MKNRACTIPTLCRIRHLARIKQSVEMIPRQNGGIRLVSTEGIYTVHRESLKLFLIVFESDRCEVRSSSKLSVANFNIASGLFPINHHTILHLSQYLALIAAHVLIRARWLYRTPFKIMSFYQKSG